MSAIIGLLYEDEARPGDDAIRTMMRALDRYPADDRRVWNDGRAALGCHAQWITPESVKEPMPYYDEAGRLAIAADAILDNRHELYDRLNIPYGQGKWMSDGELILRAYRRWGADAPGYLIGDFAFVIWDERAQTLFGARDLVGNRTLYYHASDRLFACATVADPLFALPGLKKRLNEAWLAEFLAIPSMLDCADLHAAPYDGIRHLPPGHSFTAGGGKLKLRRYGSLIPMEEPPGLRSNGEYEEAFRDVFMKAVSSKMRARKGIGSSLSGGLDSGAVAAFASAALRGTGKMLRAYSYVPQADFSDWTPKSRFADERPYIRATARHIGLSEQQDLEFPGGSPWTAVDDWLDLLDAPYKCFENSFWMTGIFEQAARQDIGVLLTGAGGNLTVSWGSAVDYYGLLARRLRLLKLGREIPRFSERMGIGRSRLLKMVLKSAFPVLDKPAGEEPALIHPDFARTSGVEERLRRRGIGPAASPADFIRARLDEFESLTFPHMTGNLETRLSLRYGIWERDPTYDPRVIRFCLSVPLEQYVQDGVDRSLMRRATRGYLPDEVRLNQRYRGVQGADWIHRMRPEWRAFMDELKRLCADSVSAQFLNVRQIKASMEAVGTEPRPELAFDSNARLLMRSLIVYRFLKRLA
ncbi:asparagine synthase (glutamine-hydrolysing) [Paenibacillus sp. UNC496MF]|uniref:asparagine synthase-related protein n=1 Tax=Paenibacillus sp. UNC496MF TaxID=1502753 RepID=UPI0008E38A8F|nr:asparagine synthase-related protein [Paenibacillus sp. UNC496MF]SFI88986.1 asparagine synthase (glutamine-hydrolysing) [Paenibacillus sp. UNC496MF]